MKNKKYLINFIALTTALIPINAYAVCSTTGTNPYNPNSGDVVVCDGENVVNQNFGDFGFLIDNQKDIKFTLNNSTIENNFDNNVGINIRGDLSTNNTINVNNTDFNFVLDDFGAPDANGIKLGLGADNNLLNINQSTFNISNDTGSGVEINSNNNNIKINNSTVNLLGLIGNGVAFSGNAENNFVQINDSNFNFTDFGNTGINFSSKKGNTVEINDSYFDLGRAYGDYLAAFWGGADNNKLTINNSFATVSNSGDILEYQNGTSETYVNSSSLISNDESIVKASGGNNYINFSNGTNLRAEKPIWAYNDSVLNVELDGTNDPILVDSFGDTAINFADKDDILTIKGSVSVLGNINADNDIDNGGVDTLNFIDSNFTLRNGSISGFENISFEGKGKLINYFSNNGTIESLNIKDATLTHEYSPLDDFKNLTIINSTISSDNSNDGMFQLTDENIIKVDDSIFNIKANDKAFNLYNSNNNNINIESSIVNTSGDFSEFMRITNSNNNMISISDTNFNQMRGYFGPITIFESSNNDFHLNNITVNKYGDSDYSHFIKISGENSLNNNLINIKNSKFFQDSGLTDSLIELSGESNNNKINIDNSIFESKSDLSQAIAFLSNSGNNELIINNTKFINNGRNFYNITLGSGFSIDGNSNYIEINNSEFEFNNIAGSAYYEGYSAPINNEIVINDSIFNLNGLNNSVLRLEGFGVKSSFNIANSVFNLNKIQLGENQTLIPERHYNSVLNLGNIYTTNAGRVELIFDNIEVNIKDKNSAFANISSNTDLFLNNSKINVFENAPIIFSKNFSETNVQIENTLINAENSDYVFEYYFNLPISSLVNKNSELGIKNGSKIIGKSILGGDIYYGLDIDLDGSKKAVEIIGTSGTAMELGKYSGNNLNIAGDVTIFGNVYTNPDINFIDPVDNKLILNNTNLNLINSELFDFGTFEFSGNNLINGNLGYSRFDREVPYDNQIINLDYNESLEVVGNLVSYINFNADKVEVTNNQIIGKSNEGLVKYIKAGDNFESSILSIGNGTDKIDLSINQNPSNLREINATEINFSNNDDILRLGNSKISGTVDAKEGIDQLYFVGSDITTGGKFIGFEKVNFDGNIILNGDLDIADSKISFDKNQNLLINGDFIGDIDLNSKTIASDGDVIIGVENNNSFSYTGNGFNFEFDEGTNIVGNSTFKSDLTVGNNAFISPGNSVGTINVIGNLNLAAGSTYNAEFDKSGIDLVAATGNINIDPNATLNIIPINDQFSGGDLSLLTAGGNVNGSFGTVNPAPNYFGTDVVYSPNSVNLQYVTPSTISAQAISAAQTGLKFNDIVAGQASKNSNFWVEAVYSSQRKSYNDSSFYNSFNNNVYGMALGGSKKLDNDIYIGYAVADLKSNIRIDEGEGEGSNNGIFGSLYTNAPFKFNNLTNSIATGAITFGYENVDYERTVLLNTGTSSAKSDSDNFKLGGLLQLSMESKAQESLIFTPRFGLSYNHIFAKGYTENNAGNAGISLRDYNYGSISPFVYLGMKPAKDIKINNKFSVNPNLEIGLSSEFITGNRNINASFTNTGTNFDLPISKKGAIFGSMKAGFDFKVNDNGVGNISFEQKFAKDNHGSSINLEFRIPLN